MQFKNLLTFGFIFSISLIVFTVSAQEQKEKTHPFAAGQPIGVVFADLYSGISNGSNPSGFEVTRAYLGYQFLMEKQFSAKIELDIGSPNDVSEFSLLRRFAYFKEAYLQYAKNKFNVKFGIIPTQQFKLQESIWGHRYIYKSVIDQERMGTSSDLGVSVSYKIADYISLDLSLMNGEGYSSVQVDNAFKTGLGVTLNPWKGLILRWYADAVSKKDIEVLFVNFIGYEITDKLYAGMEYDIKFNYAFVENANRYAFSTYATYNFTKNWQIFARFDKTTSNIINNESVPWDLPADGSAIIAGVQYSPISRVKIALDYQDWYPLAENLANESFIYLNLYFSVWK